MDKRHLDEARSVIVETEEKLRRVLANAAKGGHYDEVAVLGELARTVGSLTARLGEVHSADDSRPESVSPNRLGQEPAVVLPNDGRGAIRKGKARFYRDGDHLVKVAWSKAKKKEYEHKAPRQVIDKLVRALKEAGGEKTLVPSDRFIPMYDDDGQEIPSYQVYVGLAWLVQEGLVGKAGRRGYTIFDGDDIEANVAKYWQTLSSNDDARR